jgi:glutaredoxin
MKIKNIFILALLLVSATNIFGETTKTLSIKKPKQVKVQPASKYTIYIYGANYCAPCHALRNFLNVAKGKNKNLDYVYIDIQKDKVNKSTVEALTKTGLPWVIYPDGTQDHGEKAYKAFK